MSVLAIAVLENELLFCVSESTGKEETSCQKVQSQVSRFSLVFENNAEKRKRTVVLRIKEKVPSPVGLLQS